MVHDDPVGVLTNEPPFPMQLQHLNNYRHLSPRTGESVFAPGLDLPVYSRGMGAMGLPGDWSSQSRFVRAAFARGNAPSHSSEADSVGQVFQILGSVAQPRGCCEVEPGQYETTRYAAVCNADRGIYYYTTEENHQITAVDLHRENLDGTALVRYPNIRFVLISPEELRVPDFVREDVLGKNNAPFEECGSLEEALPKLDILYMTRVQRERFFNEEDYIRLKDRYILDTDKLDLAREDMIVMHPLPRVNEISVEVDKDPRAAYFRQVQYGVYARMALILTLLEVKVC